VKDFTARLQPIGQPEFHAEDGGVGEELRQQLRAEMLSFEKGLTAASIHEALRLLGSPRFAELSERHVREVSEYRPIEIAGETFFAAAWTRGKEAGATLGFARLLGAELVREDLTRLLASAIPRPRAG
jgi:hypothetical protein